MRIGATDESLTGSAGLVAVSELVGRLGVVEALDAGVGAIKQRARGATGGQLLVAVACAQMAGEDFLVGLDRRRADIAGEALGPVATPASTTAAGLARRFTEARLVGIEAGIATVTARVLGLLPAARRDALRAAPTIDVDTTDVEVYGRTKQQVEFNYAGQRAARPHLATWAEAGIVLAADLGSGRDDPRAGAGGLIARAVAGLPGGAGRPRVRADAGYFAAPVAQAALEAGADFSIGVRRNPAVWRALDRVPADGWIPALGMDRAEVAVVDYAPDGWPAGTRCVIRRVRYPISEIGADPRARRRRTIAPDQLALALDGHADHVHAYSFIATNLPLDTSEQVTALEQWHRGRTDIEDRIRDAKHGAALRHMPSGQHEVNAVWMWAALLAVNLNAWLHELAGLDNGAGRGRRHLGRLRRDLVNLPGRVIHHARRTILRLPPGHQILAEVLAKLRKLPATT
ncbi:MAG: IS1380 family transposase [Candidatus Nanopelagicales bacterium]|nr:IS1380 family transposase [Candidatus Nanopelagicales bacterium]